jgi:hypothetical protein
MRQIGGQILKAYFLGWQCRIRQISVREFAGQPTPAMRPRVSMKNGEVIMPAMAVLLVPQEPSESTAFFKFQVQKTNEMGELREAVLRYLGADYFQLPEQFSDEMTAIFASGSPAVSSFLEARDVVLDFEQYSQSFRILCRARRLGSKEPARESSLWQARLFNPNVPKNAEVLSFKPDWKSATADPMPQAALSRHGKS